MVKKIKNEFVFPGLKDLATISKNDIVKVLLHSPQPVAQTKRLCGVLKFDVDLSLV